MYNHMTKQQIPHNEALCMVLRKLYWIYCKVYSTLLEKQSKFPRYNMKCRGKRDTT